VLCRAVRGGGGAVRCRAVPCGAVPCRAVLCVAVPCVADRPCATGAVSGAVSSSCRATFITLDHIFLYISVLIFPKYSVARQLEDAPS